MDTRQVFHHWAYTSELSPFKYGALCNPLGEFFFLSHFMNKGKITPGNWKDLPRFVFSNDCFPCLLMTIFPFQWNLDFIFIINIFLNVSEIQTQESSQLCFNRKSTQSGTHRAVWRRGQEGGGRVQGIVHPSLASAHLETNA